uniref:Uncharacterized protein n=1 Tax=Romanomermis culicivorax TaxID=13658 RepID=A0A915K4G3_ROMCU
MAAWSPNGVEEINGAFSGPATTIANEENIVALIWVVGDSRTRFLNNDDDSLDFSMLQSFYV